MPELVLVPPMERISLDACTMEVCLCMAQEVAALQGVKESSMLLIRLANTTGGYGGHRATEGHGCHRMTEGHGCHRKTGQDTSLHPQSSCFHGKLCQLITMQMMVGHMSCEGTNGCGGSRMSTTIQNPPAPGSSEARFKPMASGVMISYVSLFLSMPS